MKSSLLHLRSYVKELALIRMLKQVKRKRNLISENKLNKALRENTDSILSSEEEKLLIRDMKEKARLYGFSFEEYFLLKLRNKPEEQVKEYISDLEHVEIVERMNKARNQAIFDDKALTYQYFGKYYKRSCAYAVSSAKGVQTLYDFARKHENFIFKPVEKAGGGGIAIIYGKQKHKLKKAAKMLLRKYKYGVFVEELIHQAAIMEELHPASVNTVRIPTIRVNSTKTVIFHPFLRVGRGNSVVDNAGSGGIICALDVETGTVIAARDEKGNDYVAHPETGVRLIGFAVPKWKEAVKLARELAEIIPSNRYTGWDLALTDDGWIMVEGNARGQFVWQYSTLQGCRNEINQLFAEMGIKYKR